MPVIAVTPEALSATATDARRTAAGLAALVGDLGALAREGSPGSGSAELERALSAFWSAWAWPCGRLAQDAARVADLLAAASALYAEAERTALVLGGAAPR